MRALHSSLARVMHVAVTGIGHLARFPRGDDEDLNVRTPCDGPGEWPYELDVRAPADGPGGRLTRVVVWSGGANGSTHEEGREPRHGASAVRAAHAAGVGRNLEEPCHGVHAVGRGG